MQFEVFDVTTGALIQCITQVQGYSNTEFMLGLLIGVILALTFWTVAKGGFQ